MGVIGIAATAAVMALSGLAQAAQPEVQVAAPPIPVPSVAAAPPAAAVEEAEPDLPVGPRPYSEVGPAPSTRSRSAVDTPELPSRGMGGDAWSERVRARSEAAQNRQGSLDGGWTVAGEDGVALYALQLVDAPGGELEGVWRETPGGGVLPVSGLFTSASRQGSQTSLSFEAPRDGGTATLLLTPGADGWTGQLTVGGQARPVRLVRAPTP